MSDSIVRGSYPDSGLLVSYKTYNVGARQRVAAREVDQLDQKSIPHHLGAEALQQPPGRGGGPPGREEIVDDQDPLPGVDGVAVDLERVRPVLERVFLGILVAGKLAGLANRDETGAERVGERRPQHVAARFDADDEVDILVAVTVDEEVDRGLEADLVTQQRSNVPKQNAGNREIGDRPDQVFDRHAVAGSASF